jgi:hypothetical protein
MVLAPSVAKCTGSYVRSVENGDDRHDDSPIVQRPFASAIVVIGHGRLDPSRSSLG